MTNVRFSAAAVIACVFLGCSSKKDNKPDQSQTPQPANSNETKAPPASKGPAASDSRLAPVNQPPGEVRRIMTGPYERSVFTVAFSPDGRRVLVGGRGLWLCDAATGQTIRELRLESFGPGLHIWSVAISPDGRRAVSGGWDHCVRLWDLESGKELGRHFSHKMVVTGVAFAREGEQVISGSWDGSVLLWDKASGEARSVGGHGNPVLCLACTRDGSRALTGSTNILNILQELSEKMARGEQGPSFPVRSMAILASGLTVLNLNGESSVRAWDVNGGKELHRFTLHKDGVLSLAFAPDGRRILSGGGTLPVKDRNAPVLQLWEADSGKELRHFEGHTGRVYGVAYSPDGRCALSASEDKTVRLWDVESGKELYRFDGHADEVTCVAFSPDGRYAASSSLDGTVRLLKLPR